MTRERVRTAVILAAGRGTRLGARGKEQPKGFLRLGARPIVEESIAKLAQEGIERVVIATGHLSSFYEDLRARYPKLVVTAHNARYAESGSMVSLACTRELVRGDFLLLESDLVYERRALRVLLDDERPDVLLLSGPTNAGDEVWVEAPQGRLVAMSKQRARLQSVAGELVGLTKVSAPLFERMLAALESAQRPDFDYETDALVAAARERPVACHLVADLVWAEIDDEQHLQRAREQVYPVLLAARDETGSGSPAC